MLNIKNCTFNYKRKGVPTIDNFSLRLEEGGVYGLLGSNGVGKIHPPAAYMRTAHP